MEPVGRISMRSLYVRKKYYLGNGADDETDGLALAFQSSGFVPANDYSSPAIPLYGDPLRFNKYIGNRMMNNGQYGNCNVAVQSTDSPMYGIGLPFLITSVFQNPLLPIPVNANVQETPSIYLQPTADSANLMGTATFYYYLGLGLPEESAGYIAGSTISAPQGATITLFTSTWQGLPSSTVPIRSYTLHTPTGTIGPQSTGTFTVSNVQQPDIGWYHVDVEFDIGGLPSPPALRHYKSNKVNLDSLIPTSVWDSSATYSLYAIVQYEGFFYASTENDNTENTPSSSSPYWTIVGSWCRCDVFIELGINGIHALSLKHLLPPPLHKHLLPFLIRRLPLLQRLVTPRGLQ